MAVIGRHHQVLCITHLDRAAMAVHFEIEKHQKGTETITEIHPLHSRDFGGAADTQAVRCKCKRNERITST